MTSTQAPAAAGLWHGFDRPLGSLYVLNMAAANASARGQRVAILASPLHELTGLYLAVDCRAPGCHGERRFAVAELANFYGKERTVGECCAGCAAQAPVAGGCRRVAGDRANPQRKGQAGAGAVCGPEARE